MGLSIENAQVHPRTVEYGGTRPGLQSWKTFLPPSFVRRSFACTCYSVPVRLSHLCSSLRGLPLHCSFSLVRRKPTLSFGIGSFRPMISSHVKEGNIQATQMLLS